LHDINLDNFRQEKAAMFPSNSPDITLVFSGLFLIAFEKDKRFCQFSVIQAERHCLKINVKTQADSLPDAPEISLDVPNENIHFGVTRRANGVDTYEPGPFERANGHDRRDFRWVLDFEGRELHNHQIPVREGAIKRSVFVYNGLFYTLDTEEVIIRRPIQDACRTADSVSLAPQIQNGLICKDVGCDIYLSGQEEFLLKYGPDANYSMRFKKEPCINYKISVTNLCTEDVQQTPPESSDFDLYYDVLEVPKDEQFRILSALGSADDTNPCNPGRVSITNAILD
jgi:hypothetical protein